MGGFTIECDGRTNIFIGDIVKIHEKITCGGGSNNSLFTIAVEIAKV
jgi:hypothetical protein